MTQLEKDRKMADLQGRYVALQYLIEEVGSDMAKLRDEPVEEEKP